MFLMTIVFIYIDTGVGYSGQAIATELITEGLDPSIVLRRKLPHFDREGTAPFSVRLFRYLAGLLPIYWGLIAQRLPPPCVVHLSLGLTRFALIRDGLALLFTGFRSSKDLLRVLSLNGSVFTTWKIGSIESRIFRFLSSRVSVVTCVGSSHAAHLKRIGVEPEKIMIIPNTCEYDAVSSSAVIRKHILQNNVLHCLFLSSLKDTKGYPEYLEALEQLSKKRGIRIDAVLCGPISICAYRKRFQTAKIAQAWVEDKLACINQSNRVRIQWLRGASGDQKRKLFESSQVFVLPTYYPVEAQPLVLLEAMAHGCAIITTDFGEIPDTLGSGCAIILHKVNSKAVASSIELLAEDVNLRLNLAFGGWSRYKKLFHRARYVNQWKNVFYRKFN